MIGDEAQGKFKFNFSLCSLVSFEKWRSEDRLTLVRFIIFVLFPDTSSPRKRQTEVHSMKCIIMIGESYHD